MKLLVVEPRGLFPPDTGAKILSGNVLRHLAKNHDVTVLVNVDPRESAAHTDELRRKCGNLVTVPWSDIRNFTPHFYLELSKCLLRGDLYAVKKFCTPELKKRAAELAAAEHFDAVIWDTISAFMPGVDFGRVPRIALAHNVEHKLRELQAGRAGRGLKAAYLRYYARKTCQFETLAFTSADHVATVSDADARYIGDALGISHVSALPPGVDAEYFAPAGKESDSPEIVFTGSMDWQANQDAAMFFVHHVLPLIKETVPDTRFTIVGRRPPAQILALAEADPAHVKVTGTVDDVRPYLARARVVAVPILFGSGIKIKVFEAMGMAKAVVVTTIGAEGLPLVDRENVLIADSAQDIAARCIELLGDTDLRRKLGQSARATVLNGHDWSVVASELANICERVIQQRTGQ